ncbi:MAG: hypothetical protein WCX73_05680 [Candidatus Pacearchaeota archaeon]|jgi:hypothetical protein
MPLIIEHPLKEELIERTEILQEYKIARKVMQDTLVKNAKTIYPKMVWLIWLLSRFYKKNNGKRKVSYNFYLFPDKDKYEKFILEVRK